MSPDFVRSGHQKSGRPKPRAATRLLRLGLLGVFLTAGAVSAVGFALFGCACRQVDAPSTNKDGFIVNPPDPPRRSARDD
jgi:hypothetical protein